MSEYPNAKRYCKDNRKSKEYGVRRPVKGLEAAPKTKHSTKNHDRTYYYDCKRLEAFGDDSRNLCKSNEKKTEKKHPPTNCTKWMIAIPILHDSNHLLFLLEYSIFRSWKEINHFLMVLIALEYCEAFSSTRS